MSACAWRSATQNRDENDARRKGDRRGRQWMLTHVAARQLREHLDVFAGAIAHFLERLLRARGRVAQAFLAGLERLLDPVHAIVYRFRGSLRVGLAACRCPPRLAAPRPVVSFHGSPSYV